MSTTYRTVVIAGQTRLTRAPSVVTPLPKARPMGKLNRYVRVADAQEQTTIMPRLTPVTIPVYSLRDRFL